MKKKQPLLKELELDALSEILNISFGSAAADLADLMDIFIKLSLPEIGVHDCENLGDFIFSGEGNFDESTVIFQNFHGQFEGAALLIFPYGMEKELLSYFQDPNVITYESDELVELEKEALMEMGSMLTGACIGRIFNFIDSNITYLPPQAAKGEHIKRLLPIEIASSHKEAVTMKTGFSFEDRKTQGTLILITYEDSVPFLKSALSHFLE